MTTPRLPRRSGPTRRGFLARTGALAVGAATVSGRADAGPVGRFIVDTREVGVAALRDAGLDVVHDVSQVDLAAVVGPRPALARLTDAFGRDVHVPGPPMRTGVGGETGAGAGPRRSPEAEVTTGLSGISTVDAVVSAAEGTEGRGEGIATDAPLYPLQWDKQALDVPAVQEITRGEGARVAILDSGVHAEHPDLQGRVNLDLSRNFTRDGLGAGRAYAGDHGTVCAGVVAATGATLVGTAPAAELVDCRVFAADGGGTFQSDYLAALTYAADVGCDVANLSLGPVITTPLQQALYARPEHTRAVEYAAQRGTVTVVSAGNDAIDLRRYGLREFSPGPTSMVVSATGPLGFGWPIRDLNESGGLDSVSELEDPIDLQAPASDLAPYSNYGTGFVSVSAPGGNFDSVALQTNEPPDWWLDMLPVDSVEVTTDDAGEFAFETGVDSSFGTSFASPQVAATVALVRSLAPSMPPAEVKALIEATARTVDGADPSPFHGAGFLDPLAAVRAVV